MNSLNPRTSFLFKKYYNQAASPEEVKELLELIKDTPDDILVLLMRDEWDNLTPDDTLFSSSKSREMLNKILPERYVSHEDNFAQQGIGWLSVGKLSIAAACLVFISVSIYFYRAAISPSVQQIAATQIIDDVPPGGNKAVLTLTDGKRIILDSLQNGVVVKTSNFEIDKIEDGQLVYRSLGRDKTTHLNNDLNIISTPRGGEYRVVLPDGSKVWLNAASSIKFPAVFRGRTREVELRGEAYFEVAKNAQMPFRVKSKQAEIEVLGTHFNVRAYTDEALMKTTLVEGSVKVRAGNSNGILKPGDQAVFEKNNMQILTNIDVDEQIAWKNGLFQFNDASLEDVMIQAALWYDLKVSYAGKIPQKHLTGKTSRKVNVAEFLNMLNYIGVDFKRNGKNILITN